MKDQISALMDDELDIEQAQHLITAAKAGGEVAQCWATYHLIGDVMRGNPIFKSDFQQRIMQELAKEPTALNVLPAVKQQSNQLNENVTPIKLVKPQKRVFASMGWSVAASVAAVMFVSVMVMKQQATHDITQSTLAIASNTDAKKPEVLPPLEIAQNMPSEYLLAHQSAAPNSVAYYIHPAAYSESK